MTIFIIFTVVAIATILEFKWWGWKVKDCTVSSEGIAIKVVLLCGSEMLGKVRGWVSLSVFVAVEFFFPFSFTTVGNFQEFSISMYHRQMCTGSIAGEASSLTFQPSHWNCNLKKENLYICIPLLRDTYTVLFPV